MRLRLKGGPRRPSSHSRPDATLARWISPAVRAALGLGVAAALAVAAYLVAGVSVPAAFAVVTGFVLVLTLIHVERTEAAALEAERRNRDLTDLVQLGAGLAGRAHDRDNLVHYAETALGRLTGAPVRVRASQEPGGIPLVAGAVRVGSLGIDVDASFQGERWERLREAILPQLATSLETAILVDQLRRRHVETIAALSRSMEAKDWETSGHTERVAEIAVALARRLGYRGAELEAIEVGALLHDIGKIGIPEGILRKAGPLDDEEWAIMKQHPVIAEYILSGIDLPPIVREIARWSHERIDGGGYPDGLAGPDIPLPARIAFVADAYDAITTDRPYRARRGAEAALREIRANAGTQFSREVVHALEEVARRQPDVLASREPESRVA